MEEKGLGLEWVKGLGLDGVEVKGLAVVAIAIEEGRSERDCRPEIRGLYRGKKKIIL